MRKNIFSAIALSAVLLTGCNNNSEENFSAEMFSEADTILVTEISSVTTSVTSETVIFCEESDFEETSAEVTETEIFTDKGIKITPANELYSVYPKRIIYPEQQPTNIKAETTVITEDFEKDGKTVVAFSAEYPVFSGGDEAVMKKINDGIRTYIDNIYAEEKESAEGYELPEVKDGEMYDFPYDMCGFYYQRIISDGEYYGNRGGIDINGNILSIYFEDFSYGAGAAHGSGTPVPMMFDLRTGERVFFSDLIEDADGMSEALSKALFDYRYAYTYTNSAYRSDDADKYAEFNEKRISEGFRDENFVEFGTNEEGIYFAVYRPADDRVVFREGCVSMYLAPYEYGSHSDGIRRVDAPISDIMPFLNEEGRALMEGYAAAESEPVNVIENKGKRYFDNIFPVLTLEVDNYYTSWFNGVISPRLWELTDNDYEFMGLFPDVVSIELHGCKDIDFEKLAKIKNIDNIKNLELEYCEFGDISPLRDTNISYIGGTGVTVPFEQAEFYRSREGNYISGSIVGPEYVDYKGHTFALTGNGVMISDRELDDIDFVYIAAQEEIWRLDLVRCTLDYERLAELDNFRYLALEECRDIDFAAIAKMTCINSIGLDRCVFDDISPLYGSGITRIDGEKSDNGFVSNFQMQEFEKFNGGWVDSSLVGI